MVLHKVSLFKVGLPEEQPQFTREFQTCTFNPLEVGPQILHIMKPSVGKGEVNFGNYWVHRIKINVFLFLCF